MTLKAKCKDNEIEQRPLKKTKMVTLKYRNKLVRGFVKKTIFNSQFIKEEK